MEDHGGSRDSRQQGIDAGISVEDHGGSRDSREGGIDVVINMEDHGGSRDSQQGIDGSIWRTTEEAGTVGSKE